MSSELDRLIYDKLHSGATGEIDFCGCEGHTCLVIPNQASHKPFMPMSAKLIAKESVRFR
jgi:hypothetical protein